MRPARTNRRSGLMIVAALVALVFFTLLSVELLRSVGLLTKQRAQDQSIAQADWLVYAGLQRGAFLLETDPAYVGETWTISPESLGGPDGAEVAIQVETKEGPAGANERRLQVTAVYPLDEPRSVRRTRTQTLTINPAPSGDQS